MSIKLQKRLSSKKKKSPKCSAQTDFLCSLGLEAFITSPLDPTSMLEISTWALENCHPVKISDLPYEFLQRLWLLSPDARSPSISSSSAYVENDSTDVMNEAGEDKECAVNPLDLVTAVFMSSNTFLQQEIVSRMVCCRFAVPLVLPNVDPQENGCFLLWPLRSVFGKWRCYNTDEKAYVLHGGELASTPMPLVSCVRLGHCNISKSQILNYFMQTEAFLHKGSAGGQQPHRLANGMVEIAWCLPRGDANTDTFHTPVVLANLRGDACVHEKSLTLLCQASSVVVIFCGNLQEKERQLVSFSKNTAKNRIIVVDVSDSAEMESSAVRCIEQNSENIPEDSLLQAKDLSVQDLANRLCSKLKCAITDPSTHVTLLAAAQLALNIDMSVDEGPICRKAMALAEKVLKDLDKGSAQYQEKQLPLQGPLWRKLAEIEKEERKHKDLDCQSEKKEILEQLSCYKITPAMKMFTHALFTNDKMERTYFLNCMKLKLTQIQDKTLYGPKDVCNKLQNINGTSEQATESENRISVDREENLCTDSSEVETVDESAGSILTEQQNLQWHAPGTYEDQTVEKLSPKPQTFVLGLQHFLREMGLIYQLTHIKPGNMSHNVLHLPSLAVELLLYGVPLEIMDGDASNIPVQWLACVLAELQRLIPQEQSQTRVLTTLGSHSARNAEVLSAIFNVRFFEERNRCSRGIYLLALRVPANLKNDLKCDFLLLLDVEGLCSGNDDKEFLVLDNEMATVAAGLADVLIENVSSHSSSEFDNIFTVLVNALLRIRDRAPMPICQIVSHDDNINSILQSRQLNRVLQILQTKNGLQNISRPTTVIGPWNNESLSEPVDLQYGNAVMALKNNMINAIKESHAILEATSLPLFIVRLCSLWDAVRADSFSVNLQNTDIALSFSMLCTELSQWEATLEENMERWFMEAIKKIFATQTRASHPTAQNDLLNELMDEARAKVITEVDAVISKLEAYWMTDQYLTKYSDTLKPVLTNNMGDLRERETHKIKQRLMRASENNCSSFKMRTFGTLLKNEQEIKLCELIDYSKANKILLEDKKLEEEFESVWCKTVTTVDLRPFETEDITPRVKAVLQQNLKNRGLHKYMKNMDIIGQNPPEAFQICHEHTAHQTRLKYMFKEHRKNMRSQAQQVASCIIDQYNYFVAAKSRLQLDFSDSYITELLEIIEKTLSEKNIEVRLAFEVDLKVYLCSVACKDFQKLHDSYTKDKNLLERINATKTASLAEFVYQFRKRDQGQRVAHAFTSQVIKPIVLDYIYSPLGMTIVAEIQSKHPEFQSPLVFYQSLLEELLNDDYANLFDFLLSYDTFKQNKIQECVLAYLSESSFVNEWRHQRLGKIIGKVASAVSQIGDHNGMLSSAKLLLEDVCLVLEEDIDMDINRAALDGPLFDISTDWDRFVTCLMEEIAAMRLQLSQEFSQPVEGASLLQKLHTQPQDYFIERLRGCEVCCPSCRAPCEVNDREHGVHRVSLHRPKGLLPSELYVVACNAPVNTEALAAVPSSDPNMSICCEAHSTNPALYWRFVLAKFSEQHQTESHEEWRKITQEEALDSLKEIFNTEHGS